METQSGERIHIGFFGMRNAGKSSLVNAVTGQNLSVVSDVLGTTTDPVKKAMELLPLGPVVIIDTPGLDDEGELGNLRIKKARQILGMTDIAILCVDARAGISDFDRELVSVFEKKNIPYIVAYNKSDLTETRKELKENEIYVSAKTGENITQLKEKMATLLKDGGEEKKLLADIVSKGDLVVMVIPIDAAAPKGRIILPQQQTLRELLDIGATAVCCKDTELSETLSMISKKPNLVITDSQVFGKVSKIVPADVMLTSFSILFARYKGNLETLVRGAAELDNLKDGDAVLISEGCTHHRQCGDIGTGKLPKWIEEYTGKKLNYEFTMGTEFPEDLSKYSLILHCGGCMLNAREMQSRLGYSEDEQVPITNYGVSIAQINGILKRSLEPFGDIAKIIKRS
ncbi:MAG: [Clostridia bacterium]|nr:[FeFe] hydrogenase H-cluster maturation GTPase HydF [Clostridia bacterium]